MGRLFVFSAPSGTGKSTIIKTLRNDLDALGYSVSHTSRKPRGNEKDGVDYHFVGRSGFEEMIKDDAFVEWAEVYDNLYGTSYSSLNEQMAQGLDVLLDLDPQGAKNIKRHFEDSVLIYVLPPSLKILEKRLKGRGTDDEQVVKMRMEKAVNDIKNSMWYDYIIINDDLEKAIKKAQSIVVAERCRTHYQVKKIKNWVDTFQQT